MKVGDYVRTETGIITRIKMFYEKKWEEPELVYARFLCEDMEIYEYPRDTKVSPNIIDLIEVGDYVNGYYVNKITDIDTGLPILCNFDLNTMRWTPLEEIDIWYSIVTKEQFESMEYKVKE